MACHYVDKNHCKTFPQGIYLPNLLFGITILWDFTDIYPCNALMNKCAFDLRQGEPWCLCYLYSSANKGELALQLKTNFNMFCALSQKYQHCVEK